MDQPVSVFDGHNDTLLRLYLDGGEEALDRFLAGGAPGHIDLEKARAGHLIGGLFAIFPPSQDIAGVVDRPTAPPHDLPLPDPLPESDAIRSTIAMASILHRLERRSKGRLTICRSVPDIEAAMAAGSLVAVLHVEGAEAIGPDLHMLDVLHAAGLRSLGPVWSRPNVFGHGVPMRYGDTPDVGDGLTEAGKRLIARCFDLRIMVDLSHLNLRGFEEVAAVSPAPLVATHSNAHAVTPHCRNLTDAQLDVIRSSRGVVGLNFATPFLRADGRTDPDTPLDVMLRHLDHLLGRLGEDGVALGSDFDGATIPRAIGSAAGLPRLIEAMGRAGYGTALIEKIAWRNWLSALSRTWER